MSLQGCRAVLVAFVVSGLLYCAFVAWLVLR